MEERDEAEPARGLGRVVLASGGPLMVVESTQGDNAVCSWMEGSKKRTAVLPVACIRSLVPFQPPAA